FHSHSRSLNPFSLFPFLFFLNHTSPTEIYTLSLHDALPIFNPGKASVTISLGSGYSDLNGNSLSTLTLAPHTAQILRLTPAPAKDRKSTRLNSSHVAISYAVFCLKKKKIPYKSTCSLFSVIG